MTTTAVMALSAMALVALASAMIGSLGVRFARSTSDFLVASRTVGPASNAWAEAVKSTPSLALPVAMVQ